MPTVAPNRKRELGDARSGAFALIIGILIGAGSVLFWVAVTRWLIG